MLDKWLNQKKEVLEYINFIAGILLVCAMPFTSHRLPIFLNIWLGTWLLEGNFKAKYKANYSIQNRNLLILGVLFYFSYVFGLLFTPDVKLGLVDIVQKLSLLIAPIVLLGANEKYYNKMDWILISFAGANVAAGVSCFYLVYKDLRQIQGFEFSIKWIKTINQIQYTHVNFSKNIHPAYFGMYILLSIASLLTRVKEYSTYKLVKVSLSILACIVLLVTMFFLSSRANVLAGLSVMILLFATYLIQSQHKWRVLLIGITCLCIIGKFTLKIDRLKTMGEALKSIHKSDLNQKIRQIDIRIDIWKAGVTAIKEHPVTGAGTGNERNLLTTIYMRQKSELCSLFKFDAHNQYIQNYLGQGFLGFIVLVSILFYSLYLAQTKHIQLLSYMILILSINFLFESVLQTISGIAFFSFFIFFFGFREKQQV